MMGKIKDKELYDVIKESKLLQELIREIANTSVAENKVNSPNIVIDNSREIEQLNSKIRELQMQLNNANNKIAMYSNLEAQLKMKTEENESLKADVLRFKSNEENYKSDIHSKELKLSEFQNMLNQVSDKNTELLSKLEAADKTIDTLKQQFDMPVYYLKLYKALPESVKNGLEDVIIDKNEITFIASCANEDNLTLIWRYIKDMSVSSEHIDDFKTLSQIFDYFFDVFNSSLPETKFVRDDVEIGDYFDDDDYDRCAGSSTSGNITEIILRGYKSVNTGNIIQKSLVRV